ncbi:MAG: AgmX/PglI C-terminal domain-containing protein [Nannocystaceae bacterium]|nr:AgmX/PglI C-terminal domain-containing protein [Nannocystaceae bacterium]
MRCLAIVGLVLACEATPTPASPAPAEAAPTPVGKAEPAAVAPAPPQAPTPAAAPTPSLPRGPAPAASDASRAERERMVLALLAGADASHFAVEDVEPGDVFDVGLRDRVAPRESVGGVPQVKQGAVTVGKGLDRDIVRRILRAHINELRFCYNQGLVRDTALAGEVTLAFTIAADGSVSEASQSASTLAGKSGTTVAACMVKASRRWKYPKPERGGSVEVVYPVELRPG